MSRIGFVSLALCTLPLTALAQDWPQFRGPDGQGHSAVQQAPLTWSETENVAWKTPIAGLGWSSPAIQGGQMWLTTGVADEQGGQSLRAICLDPATGREIHNVEVLQIENPGRVHSKNSHASPSPVIVGDRVFVHYGNHGTACLSTDGKLLWTTVLKYNHVHGPGGSPVAFEDLLIINCDGGDVQYVVALEQSSGNVRWKTERPQHQSPKKFAFSTPLLVEIDGAMQLISPGAGGVSSYDPRTGEQLWRVSYGDGYSVVPRPVFGHGLVFVSSSYDSPMLLAIRPDGRGDVTETHVPWTLDKGAPHNPSPLVVGDELYMVSDRGIATCVDAKTGEVHWQERLGGNFSASPLFAAGRIYFLDENGTTTVIAPGTTFTELAKNSVEGRTLASLVPVEGAMFLRTDTHLYRIEAAP